MTDWQDRITVDPCILVGKPIRPPPTVSELRAGAPSLNF
jgi:hypothetical protein